MTGKDFRFERVGYYMAGLAIGLTRWYLLRARNPVEELVNTYRRR